jgi:plasmid stabilization system protein ParE
LSYRLVFRPQAAEELLDAKQWYDENRSGLGDEFVEAVESTFQRIAETPLAFAEVHGSIRRAIMRRFPYGVYFRVLDAEIVVLGVIHGRRDPRRWQSR